MQIQSAPCYGMKHDIALESSREDGNSADRAVATFSCYAASKSAAIAWVAIVLS
jgi:hypothetical protein